MDRVAVRNAADPKQVKAAGSVEKRRLAREDLAAHEVLKTRAGRALLRSIVLRAGTREGIFDHSGSVTYFRAGKQNFGFELLAWFESLDPELWAQAEAEARKDAEYDRHTLDAAQVPSSQEKDDQ